MEMHPLNTVIERVVDSFISETKENFQTATVVARVLQHPEIRLIRRGLDMHDRAEGLEDVFLRDVDQKVTAELQRRGCSMTEAGGSWWRGPNMARSE